jgi:hypothetical protein
MRFLNIPGEELTGMDDTVMGLLGDIRPGCSQQWRFRIGFPPCSHRMVCASHSGRYGSSRGTGPTSYPSYSGPFVEDTPDTEVVHPRNLQLLPSKYAPLLLQNDSCPRSERFTILQEAIALNGELEACRDVLVWLRAASTAQGGGGVQAGMPVVLHQLPALHLPNLVYEFVMSKVQGGLPALQPPGPSGQVTPSTDVAGLVRALAEVQQQGRQERAGGGDREPKQITEV